MYFFFLCKVFEIKINCNWHVKKTLAINIFILSIKLRFFSGLIVHRLELFD